MRDFLTSSELFMLKEAHLAERNKRQADRIKTILLLNEGWSYEEVAKVLLLDDQTLRRYLKQYQESGLYEELKRKKGLLDRIYFMDGVHPQHNVEAGRGWILKGEQKEVRTNMGRRRINLNGAYSAEDQELVIGRRRRSTRSRQLNYLKRWS